MQQSHQANLPTNTMAIVSLASGILSWFAVPVIGAIVAIVTGHMARSQIKASLGTEGGDGLAIVGLILGYVHMLVMCAGFLFFLLFFGSIIGLSGCALLSDAASEISKSVILSTPLN
jgi:hypothetical protein